MPAKRTPKVEALVVNAIRRLQDVQGSTSREISNFISQEYDVPLKDIKRQVQIALQRGVSYGILQRSTSGYYSCNRDYLGQLPLGDGTGDEVMEICPKQPWRRRGFFRWLRRQRRRRSRSRQRQRRRRRRRRRPQRRRRRSRTRRRRARPRRRRSRTRRRRARPRRRRRTTSRRRRRNGRRTRTRTRAEPDEMEIEAMITETKENDVSKDDASRKSDTSISEHLVKTRLQKSSRDSLSSNSSDV